MFSQVKPTVYTKFKEVYPERVEINRVLFQTKTKISDITQTSDKSRIDIKALKS